MKNMAKKCTFGLGEDGNFYKIISKANGQALLISVDGASGYILKDENFIKEEANSLMLTKTSDGAIEYQLDNYWDKELEDILH